LFSSFASSARNNGAEPRATTGRTRFGHAPLPNAVTEREMRFFGEARWMENAIW